MKVFKYTKIEFVKNAIENGIYAGKLNSFNDPYEVEGILYSDDYRVCCVTNASRKMLMWAYYLNHVGCCLEFEITDNEKCVKEIKYSDEYKDRRQMSQSQLLEALYTKGKEWEYEKESRIIYNKNSNDSNLWNMVNDEVYFKARVINVVFGLNTDFKKDDVQELLRFLKKYNEEQGVKNKVMVLHLALAHNKYALVSNGQFDYIREIKSY